MTKFIIRIYIEKLILKNKLLGVPIFKQNIILVEVRNKSDSLFLNEKFNFFPRVNPNINYRY